MVFKTCSLLWICDIPGRVFVPFLYALSNGTLGSPIGCVPTGTLSGEILTRAESDPCSSGLMNIRVILAPVD